MQRLKIITTIFVVLGIAMIVSYPWTVGSIPVETATNEEKKIYLIKMVIFVTVVLLTWLAAATSALLMIRRIRMEYLEQSEQHLQELLSSRPPKKNNERESE
ncbi:MAG TPA: hypothetical protein VNK96_04355 [Fimbriimonadales bacterium]|nr:hypothetical protein [Fimbriimonadales bacterium]